MTAFAQNQIETAMQFAGDPSRPSLDRVEMLQNMADEVLLKAVHAEECTGVHRLHRQALVLADELDELERARAQVRYAAALLKLPGQEDQAVDALLDALQHKACPVLWKHGLTEEAAVAEMNLGLLLQERAGSGRAALKDAIGAYQRAARTFSAQHYPLEFALLQNNLASAYLMMPTASPAGRMAEALAVQAFESALAQLDREKHPHEYAMLQNNLGNALQYAASGHPLDNNLRALEAYDEALKIRNARDTPQEFANTMANMGNCLANLPSAAVSFDPRSRAQQALLTAERVFEQLGLHEHAVMVRNNRQEHGL